MIAMAINYNKERMQKILLGVKHNELKDAIIADLVDVIPIVGDISNVSRVVQEKGKTHKSRQIVDFLGGALPDPIGGAIDFLTPTNTIKYLSRGHLTPSENMKTFIEGLKK